MRCSAAAAGLWMSAAAASACPAFDNARALRSADETAPPAFFELGAVPISAPFEIAVQVCAPDRADVTEIEFDAVMPAHQHGMNYDPEIVEVEPGLFRVSNIVFHMPGSWELRVAARTDAERFTYVAEVEVE